MSNTDKLETTVQIARDQRRGAKLVVERPSGTALNTAAMRLVVSGKMAGPGNQRMQFHNDLFGGELTVPLPDDFLPTARQGWVRAAFSVADVAGGGLDFLQRARLVFANGHEEPLWDAFTLPRGAGFDSIILTWTVVE